MNKPLAILLLGLAACGDDTASHDSGHHHDTDHGGHTASCDDGVIDEYVAGISKTGEAGFTVAIVEADPAPPDVGVNAWTLEVTDLTGAPVTDGSVVLTPFMPLHAHGTTPETFDAVSQGDGTWGDLEMDLFMPGLWEVTVEVTDDADATDAVMFRFCLEG